MIQQGVRAAYHLGRGSIARAHTAREYVELEEVEAMTEFFVALLGSA